MRVTSSLFSSGTLSYRPSFPPAAARPERRASPGPWALIAIKIRARIKIVGRTLLAQAIGDFAIVLKQARMHAYRVFTLAAPIMRVEVRNSIPGTSTDKHRSRKCSESEPSSESSALHHDGHAWPPVHRVRNYSDRALLLIASPPWQRRSPVLRRGLPYFYFFNQRWYLKYFIMRIII